LVGRQGTGGRTVYKKKWDITNVLNINIINDRVCIIKMKGIMEMIQVSKNNRKEQD